MTHARLNPSKKLVVDAHGPTVPIGGGAWSGKDLNKVDRLGGYLARELAVQAVKDCSAREALVTLEYIPGCDAPATIDTIADGHAARCRPNPASVTNSAVTARLVAGLPNLQDMEYAFFLELRPIEQKTIGS